MSSALAIAAVTAVLKDILENGLTHDAIATSIGDTLITAIPPDRISVGADERPQLNIFLYQVSPNRNADWVGRDRIDVRLPPPLALDLHYLLTAYGPKDFQSELLLGYALQLLHEIPILNRDRVYTALKHAASLSSFGVLSQALATLSIEDLADQIAPIKLGSEFFSMEETSKLWSSLQTHYRPSAGYQASMILISKDPSK
jgi:Pvc16 N-terminal domain